MFVVLSVLFFWTERFFQCDSHGSLVPSAGSTIVPSRAAYHRSSRFVRGTLLDVFSGERSTSLWFRLRQWRRASTLLRFCLFLLRLTMPLRTFVGAFSRGTTCLSAGAQSLDLLETPSFTTLPTIQRRHDGSQLRGVGAVCTNPAFHYCFCLMHIETTGYPLGFYSRLL